MANEDQIRSILAGIKQESFVEGYNATDQEAMGLLISRFFGWNGEAIMDTAAYALEDANFHTESGELWAKIGKFV